MYLIIDIYGVVYKANDINTSLEKMAESGEITIVKIQGCSNPQVFVDHKWLHIELEEN